MNSSRGPIRQLGIPASRATDIRIGGRTGRVVVVALLAGVLAGCTDAGSPSKPRAEGSSSTPSTGSPSTVCAEAAISSRVRDFIDAYDRGESGLADRFFAPAPSFKWYSENGLREGPAAYDRTTLDAYLAKREREGDRLELMSVTPSADGNFGFVVRRAGELAESKGALDCQTGRFIVWSLGPNPGP